MSGPLVLIQLISEQTMQNLLPILRLKPVRVVHLATPKTAARSAHIVEAARQSQVAVQPEIHLLSRMPEMAETFSAVKRVILQCQQAGETPVVNFTGGTKLMSIGAFSAALHAQHRAMSLYVDTDDEVFVDGRTAEGLAGLFEGDFSFTPLRRCLTVNAIAVANGCERVTGGRDWRPYLNVARHLFAHRDDEASVHEAILGRGGLLNGRPEPRKPADWLPLFARSFALPGKVLELAAAASVVELAGDGRARLPAGSLPEMEHLAAATSPLDFAAYFRAVQPVQQSLSFLTGGWWEVILADAAERSGLFRDIRWSANAGQRGGADLEEDILGVDGVQAICISCKRGGAKARLLPHLEELNARARRLGGNFSRRFLAVYLPVQGRSSAALRQRAVELDVRILTPGDLSRADVFARTRPTA